MKKRSLRIKIKNSKILFDKLDKQLKEKRVLDLSHYSKLIPEIRLL